MDNYKRHSVVYLDPGGRILYLRQKCGRDEKIKFIGYVPTIVKKSSWDRVTEFMSRVSQLQPNNFLKFNLRYPHIEHFKEKFLHLYDIRKQCRSYKSYGMRE